MYWIGGNGKWSDTAHWSYSSGGTNATCIPAPNNNVIFDNNSFSGNDTVFIDHYSFCKNMTWTALTKNPVLVGDEYYLNIKGSLIFHKNLNAAFTGNYYFSSSSNDSIASDSVIFKGDVYFDNGGNYILNDDLVSSKDIYLKNSSFNLNNNNLTCEHFNSNDTLSRSFNLGLPKDQNITRLNDWDLRSLKRLDGLFRYCDTFNGNVENWYMPNMGYQENFLPAEQKKLGHEVQAIVPDRHPLFINYLRFRNKIQIDRITNATIFNDKGVIIHRLPTLFEIPLHGQRPMKGLKKKLKENT